MNKNYLSNLTNNDYVNTNSKTNELINQQLDNSEIVYDSVHLQFILYFIATAILIGFIFIINTGGNLSIFIIILLLLVIFCIFKFLKFDLINYIMNLKI